MATDGAIPRKIIIFKPPPKCPTYDLASHLLKMLRIIEIYEDFAVSNQQRTPLV